MNVKAIYITRFLKYLRHIEEVYKDNLKMHFCTYMPLISLEGTEIMAAKAKVLTENKFNSDYIVEQLIEDVQCSKRKYFSRNEQISVLKSLIEAAESRLFLCTRENSRENLFILQQMLEYNFHLSTIFIKRNSDIFSSEEIGEPFFKEIIRTLEYHENFGVFTANLDNAKAEISNLLANDKQAIQKAIGFIVSNMPGDIIVKNEMELESVFHEENISEILNSARALYKVLQMLDLVLAEKKCVIKVVKAGIDIDVKRGYQKTSLDQVERMIKNSEGKTDGIWLEKYDMYIKETFGLSFFEIERFAKQLSLDIEHGFNYRIFDEESLVEAFGFDSYRKKEIKKFFSYFVLDKSYKANSAFESEKSIRKPIIKYGEEVYGGSLLMFSIGVLTLLADIKTGTTGDISFNQKIQKDIDENRRLFEGEVARTIQETYPESKIIRKIEKISGTTAPGEMDVICFYQDIVYVFECKAPELKFTVKEEQNFLKNFTRDSKGSFHVNLSNKIDFLYNNLDVFKTELGEDNIKEIKGVFVLKYPSVALNFQESKFPIIHISQLKDIIERDLENKNL
jgi:hypothetical protein